MYRLRGIAKQVTNGWWESFCKRHPNLTLRAAASLSRARVVASDPSSLTRYFEILQDTLEEYDIIGKPNQIFNMDEIGMSFEPKHPKGMFPVGDKRPTMFSSRKKGQVWLAVLVQLGSACRLR